MKNDNNVLEFVLIVSIFLVITVFPAWTTPLEAQECKRLIDNAGSKTVYIVGHRGVAGLKPENTLAGFEKALELNVDALELDVLTSADNKLVVHHDFNLKPELTRSPNGNWLKARSGTAINQLTVKQLQQFDVGRLKPNTRYTARYPEQVAVDGQRIPLLSEVIRLIKTSGKTSVQLWIEIKTSPEKPEKTPAPEAIAHQVVTLLKKETFTQRSKILSFDWRSLLQVQTLAPSIPTVYLTSDTKQFKTASFTNPWESDWTGGFDIGEHNDSIPQTVAAAGGHWWAPKYTQVNAKQIKAAHRLGLCVAVWTPDSVKAIHKMIKLGVDAIITNRPDRLISIIR